MSIILSVQIVYTNDKLCTQNKLALIVSGSVIEIVLCIIAFKVIRAEGLYFHIALSRFVNEYNDVFKTSPLVLPPEKANKDVWDLIKRFCSMKVGVRDCFQCIFLLFILVFIAMMVFAFFTLIN